MTAGLEIQLIAIMVSISCALPGVFLVLRRMSMMSDSITHTILLGIVLAFFITHDLSSPFLIIGATFMGGLTVWLTEALGKTRMISADSAIGIVFPLLFSIAIILITRYADAVHLDTDSVLLGELVFAPFDRLVIWGADIGAKAIYTSGIFLLLSIVFISVFFKELQLVTFDPMLAATLGFSPVFVHYGLMTLVSLTAVGAFEAVGSVLVVAFMIGPPTTAYLLTDDLKHMLFLSAGFGALSGMLGYQLAIAWDVSIAGSMAVTTGILFFLVFILSPQRGFLSILLKKRRQRKNFVRYMFLSHLVHNQNEKQKNAISAISAKLKWKDKKLLKTIRQLQIDGQVTVENGLIMATCKGEADHARFLQDMLCG